MVLSPRSSRLHFTMLKLSLRTSRWNATTSPSCIFKCIKSGRWICRCKMWLRSQMQRLWIPESKSFLPCGVRYTLQIAFPWQNTVDRWEGSVRKTAYCMNMKTWVWIPNSHIKSQLWPVNPSAMLGWWGHRRMTEACWPDSQAEKQQAAGTVEDLVSRGWGREW